MSEAETNGVALVRECTLNHIRSMQASTGSVLLILPELLGEDGWAQLQAMRRGIRVLPGCLIEVAHRPGAEVTTDVVPYPRVPVTALRRRVAAMGLFLRLSNHTASTGAAAARRIDVLSALPDADEVPRDLALAVYLGGQGPAQTPSAVAPRTADEAIAALADMAHAAAFARQEIEEARRLRAHLQEIDEALGASRPLSFALRLDKIRNRTTL